MENVLSQRGHYPLTEEKKSVSFVSSKVTPKPFNQPVEQKETQQHDERSAFLVTLTKTSMFSDMSNKHPAAVDADPDADVHVCFLNCFHVTMSGDFSSPERPSAALLEGEPPGRGCRELTGVY